MDDISVSFAFRLYPDEIAEPHNVVTQLGRDSAIVIALSYPEDMPVELSVSASIMGETPHEVADNLEEMARSIREVTADHDPMIVQVDDE